MSILKRLREDFDGGFQAKEGNFDFRRASADAMDMHKLLVENQLALDNDVARAFREIYREFVLNRCKEQVLERIDKKICRPLEATLLPGQHFARAEESVEILARRLETEKQATPRLAIEEAIERTDRLVQRLEEILGEMKKLIEFNQALKVLQEIIDKQREILEAVRKKEREERLKELNDR
jgi:glutaredoxin 2